MATKPRESVIEVEVNGIPREVTVRELSLKSLERISDVLGDLFKNGELTRGLTSDDMSVQMQALTKAVSILPDKVAMIIGLGTSGIEGEALKELTPRQAIALIMEIWKVNDFAEMIKKDLAPLTSGAMGRK